MVTFVVGAACDLQINRLVFPGGGRNQLFDDGFPAGKVERVAQFDPGQGGFQPLQVFINPEGPAGVDRNDFIDPVAIQKAAVER